MQISIRHVPATKPDEGSANSPTTDQACVWITDDAGVSIKTLYLEDEQQVTIDVTVPAPETPQAEVTVGEVQSDAGVPALGENTEKL